jgi:hypothetical protein
VLGKAPVRNLRVGRRTAQRQESEAMHMEGFDPRKLLALTAFALSIGFLFSVILM